jgi:hypothetical protein
MADVERVEFFDRNQNGVAEFCSAHMLPGSTLLKGPKVAPV